MFKVDDIWEVANQLNSQKEKVIENIAEEKYMRISEIKA